MKALYELKEKLMKELEPLSRKANMSSGDLDLMHKMTDTIKNIDKICMYEEGGASHRGSYDSYGDHSMRRGYSRDGDWSADIQGHYSRDSGRHYVRGHYSRDGASMTDRLEHMMSEAGSDKEREALRRCMEQMR